MNQEVPTRERIPKSVNFLANGFLLLSALVYASAFLYAVHFRTTKLHYQVILAIACAFSILLLKLRTAFKVRLTLATVSVLTALYGSESFLHFYQRHQAKANLRKGAGQASGRVDTRTKAEVVRELRHKGIRAYPSPIDTFSPNREADELKSLVVINGVETLPLGGISNRTTVLCNESGEYVIYESDEHGYNNPKGIWSTPPLQIAAVGDSAAQGQCVSSDKNLIALIKNRYPSTVNLGMAGTGPLRNLATIREYLPTLRPRIVLWLHYEGNDFLDLEFEKTSPILKRYLTDGFTQHLLHKQLEVDHFLEAIVDKTLADEESDSKYIIRSFVMEFLALSKLRMNLGFALGISPQLPDDKEYELLRQILANAQRTVESWGGTLYFVYLPTTERYHSAPVFRQPLRYDQIRQRVLAIAQELRLPVVDVHGAFTAQGTPQELFFYPGSHYNENGYRIAAHSVIDSLASSHGPE